MVNTAAAQQVTFTKDVAPILQEKCQVCHRPGTFAPMSLLTYEEARPWAKAIREKVFAREMPPWHIDKNVGVRHFKNDRSLSDQQIGTIVKWVDGGAPRKPRRYASTARIRRPGQMAHHSRSDRGTAQGHYRSRQVARPVD